MGAEGAGRLPATVTTDAAAAAIAPDAAKPRDSAVVTASDAANVAAGEAEARDRAINAEEANCIAARASGGEVSRRTERSGETQTAEGRGSLVITGGERQARGA